MRVKMAAMKRDAEQYSRQVVLYCKNIYFAGHESTAIAAAWCLMLLALHPEWEARIRKETLQEATWLRATLHKWLDDEYCPEASNVEIIQVAADSYHKSLLEKETEGKGCGRQALHIQHSLWDMRHESIKSTIYGNMVPPGGLVTFVQKGIQYLELDANVTCNDADIDEDFSFIQPLDLITNDVYELQKITPTSRWSCNTQPVSCLVIFS